LNASSTSLASGEGKERGGRRRGRITAELDQLCFISTAYPSQLLDHGLDEAGDDQGGGLALGRKERKGRKKRLLADLRDSCLVA